MLSVVGNALTGTHAILGFIKPEADCRGFMSDGHHKFCSLFDEAAERFEKDELFWSQNLDDIET